MQCLRCGRKTEEGDVFCRDCLADMKQYPVKPGTVVQLPPKNAAVQPPKPPARRKLSPEEMVVRLKKRVRRLQILLAVAAVIFGILAALSWLLKDAQTEQYLPGQNYTAEQTSQTTEAE